MTQAKVTDAVITTAAVLQMNCTSVSSWHHEQLGFELCWGLILSIYQRWTLVDNPNREARNIWLG